MSLPTGPWTHGDVMDLHIFVLLLVWFVLDRSDIYFRDIARLVRALLTSMTNSGGPH
jgi:hypothetical protein